MTTSAAATSSGTPRIAIIGAGLTGLAAAHRLGELADQAGRTLDVTLFESRADLGGIVGTVERDGYLIDTGADSFITNKPGALALCERLGLQDRLQATDPRYRGALVLYDGRPYPVPDGFQLLSPSAMGPILRTPILSPWGKLRMACEPWIPVRRSRADESLAAFVRRRFGGEALERLVQPLVGGIYTSDPEQLSLAATLPRFPEMERHWGSVIRASRQREAQGDDRSSSGARYGLFAGLRGGLRDLVDTLVARVTPRCQIRIGCSVTRLTADPGGFGYRLTLVDGSAATFDQVLVTTPTHRAAGLVEACAPRLAAALRTIDYASSVIVVTGHPLAAVADPLKAFGLVIPHRERRGILAVSFSSRKFPNRAPEGRVLLRTFVGGALQPALCELDDADLVALVQRELGETLGVRGVPDFALVVRYPRAMPQYTLGHVDRVAAIFQEAARHPGLRFAGNAYHGVGVPDAIHSGEQAAARMLDTIGPKTPG
jgi:oxygen-dependent protoporphyrinogen oxidase